MKTTILLVAVTLAGCATVPLEGSGGYLGMAQLRPEMFEGQSEAPASGARSSTFASLVPSGSNAFSMLNGARFQYSDSNAADYCANNGNNFECNNFATRTGGSVSASLYYPFGTASHVLRNFVADGASAVGGYSDTNSAFSNATSSLWEWRSGNTMKARTWYDGSHQITGAVTGSLITCDATHKGTITFDSTLNKLKLCNGTSYETITSI